MTISRGFHRLPSSATTHHRTAVPASTSATIGQPSAGTNGRCRVATSTTHDTSSSVCIATMTG